MTTGFADAVRARIYGYLTAAGAQLPAMSGEPVRLEWQVSGSVLDGVRASFSDADDVIEFGLLSRTAGEPTNTLNVSVVVDDVEASLVSSSDTKADMNFTGWVKPEATSDGLYLACDYFAQVVGEVPA